MRLLNNGPVQTRMHEEDGKTIFERVQDCDPIAELAKSLHKEGRHGSSEMKHAAKIPNVIIERYCNDNGITFREWLNDEHHIRRVLTNPSLSHFRIWKGQV